MGSSKGEFPVEKKGGQMRRRRKKITAKGPVPSALEKVGVERDVEGGKTRR